MAFAGSINGGNPLPSTVNDFKAVIYWYDRRHEAGNTLDDFNLVLRDTDTWLPIRSSTDADDNKEMVWSSSVANKRVQLEIHGLDVTADNEGCGTNSNVVYFAWFWEDDARDDPEGPGSEIAKESP